MKIAIFHELPKGGARQSVNEISKRLKKNNTVDLYTIGSSYKKEEEIFFSNYFSFPFKSRKWKGNDWKTRLYKDTIEFYNLYKLNKKIFLKIKEKGYDVLFVHASSRIESPFILRFKNKNTVFFLHDPYFRLVYENESNPMVGNFVKKVYEYVFRRTLKLIDKSNVKKVNYVIANSFFTKKEFGKKYRRKAKVIYLGVDTKFFNPKLKIKKEFDVLFVGSLHYIDGYDTFQLIKNNLPKSVKIRELLYEKEWLDRKNMRSIYRSTRLVVCLARKEPLGLVALEAMACGVPVIAVNEGGYKETVINNKTGYLLRRTPKDFVTKINYLLKNKKKYEEFSGNSFNLVKSNWSWERSAEDIENYFRKII